MEIETTRTISTKETDFSKITLDDLLAEIDQLLAECKRLEVIINLNEKLEDVK